MNTVLKLFLSMSVSGSLLILILFWGKRFLKNRISRQWQYYIWFIVILRLLLPFGPKTNLMGKLYQAIDQTITQDTSFLQQQNLPGIPGDDYVPTVSQKQNKERTDSTAKVLTAAHPLQEIVSLLINQIWLIWLAVSAGMLIRKATIYQEFIQYVNAGMTPVSDIEILDHLCTIAEQAGVKKPIDLCVNPLISSPLLIGFFHPCIVLPSADIKEKDFQYIALHELMHYKRQDLFYKWLVQVTVCVHWFNPFVYLMSRDITKACEFSCDEAVLAKMGYNHAQNYGETLLEAMAAVGKYKELLGVVSLSENKQLLKERLGAIMSFKRTSKAIRLLTSLLTLCIIFSAFFVGIYPVEAAVYPSTTGFDSSSVPDVNEKSLFSTQADQYYEAGNLSLFQIAFSKLNQEEQSIWLDKLYADGEIAFFSVSVNQLNSDNPLIKPLAEKLYKDHSIAFFSVLTNQMSEETLEAWLQRALEDKNFFFQSMLFHKLDNDWDDNALEKEWAKKQLEGYQAVGVTKDGKNYYYQGELVNIFLDPQPKEGCYILDMNPAGIVNIKMIRSEDGQITGTAYITEEEVTELLGYDPEDDCSEDDWTDSQEITIPIEIDNVKDGEYIWLGTYDLDKEDLVSYHVSAETGTRLDIGFAKPGQKQPNPVYHTISNQRTDKILEVKSDTIVWGAKSGEYSLFIHTEGSALTDVMGYVTIIKATED